MATKTMASISSGLEAINEKKANLRKALEDLHAASSSLPTTSSSSSFTNLKWDDLDAYFTSLQFHLRRKFALLEAQKPDPPVDPLESVPVEPEPAAPVLKRPELKSFSEKMDAIALRGYILDRPRERMEIRAELPSAWKHAPNPAKLVLDATEGISGSATGLDTAGLRRVAVVLLEALMDAKVEISPEDKERALAIGVEWKTKLAAAGGGEAVEDLEKLCFLHFLAAFGLVEGDVFDMDELVEYAVAIAKHRQAVDLCRVIGFGDRISDVIQKLIDQDKQILAIKFIFQFELTEKFPPVPMLRSCALATRKIALRASKAGKNFVQAYNEEAAKAIGALKSVVKIIEDYNLESQMPKQVYVNRIEKLEKKRTTKKRFSPMPGQPPSKKQKGNQGIKFRTAGAAAFQWNAAALTHHTKEQAQPRVPMAGLLADPYQAYGLVGSAPTVTPYVGTSTDMYGVSRTHTSYSGEVDPSVTSLYPSESVVQPGYHDCSAAYGGYSYPPEYHPSNYPQ